MIAISNTTTHAMMDVMQVINYCFFLTIWPWKVLSQTCRLASRSMTGIYTHVGQTWEVGGVDFKNHQQEKC